MSKKRKSSKANRIAIEMPKKGIVSTGEVKAEVTAAAKDPVAVKTNDPVAVKPNEPVAVQIEDPATVQFEEPTAATVGEPATVKPRSKNKLIMFMSKLSDRSAPGQFEGPNGIIYDDCMQTNEAPTKYILDTLNGELDEIIYLSTNETTTVVTLKPSNVKLTAQERYEGSINAFCKARGYTPPKPIAVNYVVGTTPFEVSLSSLMDHIYETDSVYFETTGGLRDVVLLLMTMARLLEYSNRSVKMATYASFKPNKITDVTYLYRYLDLVSGVNEFMAFGQSKTLNAYYDLFSQDSAAIPASPVEFKGNLQQFLQNINNFTDSLSICDTSKVTDDLKEIAKGLTDLGDQKIEGSGPIAMLVNNLLPVVRSKPVFSSSADITLMYPVLIRWCADNYMIQQALTLYSEKMVAYANAVLNIPTKSTSDGVTRNQLDSFGGNKDRIIYQTIFLDPNKAPAASDSELLKKFLNIPSMCNTLASLGSYNKNSFNVNDNAFKKVNFTADDLDKIKKYLDVLYIVYNSRYQVNIKNRPARTTTSAIKMARLQLHNLPIEPLIERTPTNHLNFWSSVSGIDMLIGLVKTVTGKQDLKHDDKDKFKIACQRRLAVLDNLSPDTVFGFNVNSIKHARRFGVYWLYFYELRNNINHAIDSVDLSIFEKYDFIGSPPEDITTEYIRRMLFKALDWIESMSQN
ncbi:MAG: hypothetical protein LBT59_26275 [Clostridiales bacterium]|nr:hypothetical protein [Clostridiales bacterium]